MNEWQEFLDWLFDNTYDSEFPDHLAKENSKITHLYAIRIFRNNKNLNHYLNKHLNAYDLFYLDKRELFYFLKKCVIDYGISKKTIPWLGHKKDPKDKLFTKLEEKFPLLKEDEVEIVYDYITMSKDNDKIRASLGVYNDYKKEKVENKTKNKEREPLTKVIRENFVWIDR